MMNRREFCGGVAAFATLVGTSVAAEGQADWATVDGAALPDWAVRQIEDGLHRYLSWKGGDQTVAFPLITDIHSHEPGLGGKTSGDRPRQA